MNKSLPHLMGEICAAIEIYYSGRTGGDYLKTSFILCDDHSELVSKLFLLDGNSSWSDKRQPRGFKNYHEIMNEVANKVNSSFPTHLARIQVLQVEMENRHQRRNDFFHSTQLLDLNVNGRNCVESFSDLLEYGHLLFGNDWQTVIDGSRNLSTMAIFLKLESRAFSDPSMTSKVNDVIRDCPRNVAAPSIRKRGNHLVAFPADLHLRLCFISGGKEFHDKLARLLVT